MKTNEILKLIGDKEFLDKIYQFSYRRCNTSYEAEDLCSDIILAVISAVHNQGNVENFYAFVWTIARRVYADYSEKRNQTRQTISIENGDLLLAAKENEIDNFIEEAAEQELIKKIFAEISFLSKAYREVMVLYYLDEMKIKDIALKLGINETTVKQRLFSARNTVRKEVETMSNRNLSLKPIKMDFMGSGSVTGNDPFVNATRTFSQNLIYACKDVAKSAKELSEELCVPMIYVEEELEIQVHGTNGTFGTLRKQGDKYISNIIIVDEQDRIEVSKLYEKYTVQFCEVLKKYLKDNESKLLTFPYINKPKDIKQLLWVLITNATWGFVRETEKIMDEIHFSDVNEAVSSSGRKFTFSAIARKENETKIPYGYGCDGNTAHDFCGYSLVNIRNIYGPRIDAHFRVGHNLTHDKVISLLLKSIGGLPIESLTEEQKELAAKGIEVGLLSKNDVLLEPAIIIIDNKNSDGFFKCLDELYPLLAPYCEELALEVSNHIKKHIQKHLLDEYKTYNMAASASIVSCVIDKCIELGLLNEPENRLGSEGVLLVVEK